MSMKNFQSTPPRRRRPFSFSNFPIFQIFSIHASAKEATYFLHQTNSICIFSIHASAKEATCSYIYHNRHTYFSIHASAKEATSPHHPLYLQYQIFNPRLREGGDSKRDSSHDLIIFQSTPPRRRRPKGITENSTGASFQSTPPRRRRHCKLYNKIYAKIFQSTPPRRRRLGQILNIKGDYLFNPRLREGGDCAALDARKEDTFFQSTPPRRRRPQHIVIPQLSCAYLVSTTFLSTIFSFISQYIVLFPLFRVRMPCVFCVAYDSHYVPLFNIFYILFQGTPF